MRDGPQIKYIRFGRISLKYISEAADLLICPIREVLCQFLILSELRWRPVCCISSSVLPNIIREQTYQEEYAQNQPRDSGYESSLYCFISISGSLVVIGKLTGYDGSSDVT